MFLAMWPTPISVRVKEHAKLRLVRPDHDDDDGGADDSNDDSGGGGGAGGGDPPDGTKVLVVQDIDTRASKASSDTPLQSLRFNDSNDLKLLQIAPSWWKCLGEMPEMPWKLRSFRLMNRGSTCNRDETHSRPSHSKCGTPAPSPSYLNSNTFVAAVAHVEQTCRKAGMSGNGSRFRTSTATDGSVASKADRSLSQLTSPAPVLDGSCSRGTRLAWSMLSMLEKMFGILLHCASREQSTSFTTASTSASASTSSSTSGSTSSSSASTSSNLGQVLLQTSSEVVSLAPLPGPRRLWIVSGLQSWTGPDKNGDDVSPFAAARSRALAVYASRTSEESRCMAEKNSASASSTSVSSARNRPGCMLCASMSASSRVSGSRLRPLGALGFPPRCANLPAAPESQPVDSSLVGLLTGSSSAAIVSRSAAELQTPTSEKSHFAILAEELADILVAELV
mmetsp:Transcript_36285/g.43833  ORF Transcript_36285/g.43833 Transcript_36285/m.43833 type:complete len:451 (+) Transcript_36285:1106-2458(+)